MIRDLHSHARQVAIDFLQSAPDIETPFWSVRDISRKYNYSEYTAYNILKVLSEHGYLEMSPQRRAFLKRDVNISTLGNSMGSLRPAFVWPYWKREEEGNFVMNLAQEFEDRCRKSHLPHIFLENPSAWGDPSLTLRLKAISANALLAVSPPADSLILFTKLRADDIPIVVMGSPRRGYDELGVVTIDGNKTEAIRLLLRRLRSVGAQNPLIVGYGDNESCHAELAQGVKGAFPEIDDVEAAGLFTNVGDTYSHIREVAHRLTQPNRPDALVFSDSLHLELAVEMIPDLAAGARRRDYYIALFDDIGLHKRLDFPIISLTLPTRQMAQKSLEIMRNLRDHVRCSKRTLLRRHIRWPSEFDNLPA